MVHDKGRWMSHVYIRDTLIGMIRRLDNGHL